MTETSDNKAYGEPSTPDANQQKTEPFGTSPETSAQADNRTAQDAAAAGESSRASKEQGASPQDMETNDAGGAENMGRSLSPVADGGVPAPGDAQGVAVPSVQAAAGTSEESGKVDGVKVTSIAPSGKPDGEVDTRSSSTPL